MSTLVFDTRAVFQREMSLVLRDPFSVIFSLVQPLVFLGLFGPLLAGSVDPAALNGASPLQWFLPGVIVMICLFGTSTTGANLLFEIMTGSYERVLASSAAPLRDLDRQGPEGAGAACRAGCTGRVGIDPVRVQALPRTRAGRAVAARRLRSGHGRVLQCAGHRIAQAGVDVLGGSAVVAVPAVDLVGNDAAAGGRAAWIQVLGRFNPLTYIVDAERALFSGTFNDPAIGWAVLVAVITCAAGLWVGVKQVARSTT